MSLFLKDYLALHNLPVGVGYDMISRKRPFSFLHARRINSCWVTRCAYRLRKILTKRVRIYLQCKRLEFDPWFPWRGKWLPTPVFLLEESHGQRSLVGYSPWGCKESDMIEQLTLHFLSNGLGDLRKRESLGKVSVLNNPPTSPSLPSEASSSCWGRAS